MKNQMKEFENELIQTALTSLKHYVNPLFHPKASHRGVVKQILDQEINCFFDLIDKLQSIKIINPNGELTNKINRIKRMPIDYRDYRYTYYDCRSYLRCAVKFSPEKVAKILSYIKQYYPEELSKILQERINFQTPVTLAVSVNVESLNVLIKEIEQYSLDTQFHLLEKITTTRCNRGCCIRTHRDNALMLAVQQNTEAVRPLVELISKQPLNRRIYFLNALNEKKTTLEHMLNNNALKSIALEMVSSIPKKNRTVLIKLLTKESNINLIIDMVDKPLKLKNDIDKKQDSISVASSKPSAPLLTEFASAEQRKLYPDLLSEHPVLQEQGSLESNKALNQKPIDTTIVKYNESPEKEESILIDLVGGLSMNDCNNSAPEPAGILSASGGFDFSFFAPPKEQKYSWNKEQLCARLNEVVLTSDDKVAVNNAENLLSIMNSGETKALISICQELQLKKCSIPRQLLESLMDYSLRADNEHQASVAASSSR